MMHPSKLRVVVGGRGEEFKASGCVPLPGGVVVSWVYPESAQVCSSHLSLLPLCCHSSTRQ